MGAGFSVRTGPLAAGSQDVAELQGRCLAIAEDAVAALAAMAGSAGHPGLASALSGAAKRGNGAFAGMWAAYRHASQSLAATAATYDRAEQANAAAAQAVVPGLDPQRMFGGRRVIPG